MQTVEQLYDKLERHPDVQLFYGLRTKVSDPEKYSPSETEACMYPEVRARAYMARDKILGYPPMVSGKSEDERLETIQQALYIHPDWVQNHVKFRLKKHLHSLVKAYLKQPHGERRSVDLKKEEKKFMESPKMKQFFDEIEQKKKRCDALMMFDNDFDLYRHMSEIEISDFI